MLGNGYSVKFPLALLSAFTTLGCSAFMAQKSMHIHLLSASLGADFMGTMTMGLTNEDTLLVMMPTHSKLSISCCTQS